MMSTKPVINHRPEDAEVAWNKATMRDAEKSGDQGKVKTRKGWGFHLALVDGRRATLNFSFSQHTDLFQQEVLRHHHEY